MIAALAVSALWGTDRSQVLEIPDNLSTALMNDPMPEVPGRLGEILKRYYNEGIGGREVLQGVKSMKLHCQLSLPEGEFDLRVFRKRPHFVKLSVRGDSRAQGWEMGYDGQQAWKVLPNRVREVQLMDEAEARSFIHHAEFDTYLLYPYKDGKRIEYLNTEPAGGDLCHRIRVTTRDGYQVDYFIDIRSYLEAEVVTVDLQTEKVSRLVYEDYKRVEGLRIAQRVNLYEDGELSRQTVLKRVEVNLGMPVWMFKPPAE